ncbi:ABC transporter ATP-binding protein [Mesorhizobium sp. M3A.F.Ca.ET.080.04.2.1]|uniref:ABC transporter ATP-binding protein n=1 Tax=Mesorhizobium sp. M3A.F.Ca.ET.080.04.2.1 TaxID=2493676 RepID=UPI000F75DAC7|nr:ABC transporter ATP-binding protein [Mesorhizobium sp. M3A.F.Ca.ET.080.04.2.1]AZO07909.1 ABC transporter ATP-binding protein [Mesorhizobium sp. M3A.F.Ca.ET.080.04.2.1]RWF14397.1 MAG: ABC transporter ATP-binding protein [Mesorhizobium sp.]
MQNVQAAHPDRSPIEANSVTIDNLELRFPNGYVGLKSTNLHVPGGQFCTLLGPSGSGKTTLLRALAGLVTPTRGRIAIGQKDVTTLPVQARNIGFVFQNYALFPHMNVADNIAYPLKLHKWSAADRTARVKEILDLIELSHAAGHSVGQLSGGQQQRVAIGRALAYRPSLLLLDEPMGALDRRLRQQLGADLRDLQQRTGITAVYVTHDQEEAFILSDKIAVLRQGEILQYSSPGELYARPRSRFVAEFLGEANLIDAQSTDGKGHAMTAYGSIGFAGHTSTNGQTTTPALLVRPEDIAFSSNRTSPTATSQSALAQPLKVEVLKTLFLGSRCLVTVKAPDGKELLVECNKSGLPQQGEAVSITWDRSATVLLGS